MLEVRERQRAAWATSVPSLVVRGNIYDCEERQTNTVVLKFAFAPVSRNTRIASHASPCMSASWAVFTVEWTRCSCTTASLGLIVLHGLPTVKYNTHEICQRLSEGRPEISVVCSHRANQEGCICMRSPKVTDLCVCSTCSTALRASRDPRQCS